MTKSKTTAIAAEWLTLEETLARTGKSRSTVDRAVAAGEIRTKPEPVAGRKPMTLYAAEDVERVRTEPAARAVALPSALKLAQLSAMYGQPAPPKAERLFVTLEEAAELTGLTETYLRDRIHVGSLPANRGGAFGTLRIKRATLEAFEG